MECISLKMYVAEYLCTQFVRLVVLSAERTDVVWETWFVQLVGSIWG